MSHEVLYRKYRPHVFSDMIGQDHIVSVLERQIQKDSVGHAYIFHGTRGTGKTSLARIFSRALSISQVDVVEIDAASNNGVDDIRELRDGVYSLPFESPKKMYILDEVHMLSKGAFNALLKVLEEPPSHVIFVLATTEIEKVPETILSRCQVFNFKKPSEAILLEMIIRVSEKEGYTLEEGAGELISILGDGSFRDTHGILEKVFGYIKSKNITRAEVETVTGAPSEIILHNYIRALAHNEIESMTESIALLENANGDTRVLIKRIIVLMRHMVLYRVDAGYKKKVSRLIGSLEKDLIEEIVSTEPDFASSKVLLKFIESYGMLKLGAPGLTSLLVTSFSIIEMREKK